MYTAVLPDFHSSLLEMIGEIIAGLALLYCLVNLVYLLNSAATAYFWYPCTLLHIYDNAKKYSLTLLLFYFINVHYVLIKAVCLVVFSPLRVMRHLKLAKNGQLVKLDLRQYCLDFCMDSSFPDQIQYKPINSFNYLAPYGPLYLAKCFKKRDKTFALQDMNKEGLTRFVELLSSLSLFYFCATSKDMYYLCLDVRGLEFSYFSYDQLPALCYDVHKPKYLMTPMAISKNGRRMGCLKDRRRVNNLSRFVICPDSFRCYGGQLQYSVHRTYRQLILVFVKGHFNGHFERTLNLLLHDRVDTVKLVIEHPTGNSANTYHYPPTMANVVSFLNMCSNVKKIGVCFHQIVCEGLVMELQWPPVLLAGTPDFVVIKQNLEEWAATRPDLELFRLIYNARDYMLHEGKLMFMDRLMAKHWFLIEQFHPKPPSPPNLKYSHHKFHYLSFEAEYPYPFIPYRFADYSM